MPDWIVALLGVFVGFILNEGWESLKNLKKQSEYKSALDDELNTNLHQIRQKEDIANQMMAALKSGGFLPGISIPFASTVYDNHFPSIIHSLKPVERDNVRHIYSNLKVLDEIMASFEKDFKEDAQSNVVNDVKAASIGKIQDILLNYGIIKTLISDYLNGNSKDIYYRFKNT